MLRTQSNLLLLQVASRVLKVKPEKIYTAETSTDKVPNTIATAASLGSDLNGMAVLVSNVIELK